MDVILIGLNYAGVKIYEYIKDIGNERTACSDKCIGISERFDKK